MQDVRYPVEVLPAGAPAKQRLVVRVRPGLRLVEADGAAVLDDLPLLVLAGELLAQRLELTGHPLVHEVVLGGHVHLPVRRGPVHHRRLGEAVPSLVVVLEPVGVRGRVTAGAAGRVIVDADRLRVEPWTGWETDAT